MSFFKRRRRPGRFATTCIVEAMERRQLLTAVSWTGAAGDNEWTTPGNWSTGALPQPADDVTINVAGAPNIQLASGVQSIHSLNSTDPLTVSGGVLAVATTAQFAANLSLSGGTLSGGSYSAVNGAVLQQTGGTSSTLNAVTFNSNFTENGAFPVANTVLNVLGGLTLNNAALDVGGQFTGAAVYFRGTQTVGGTGQVLCGIGAQIFSADGGQGGPTTVTIAPGITFTGHSSGFDDVTFDSDGSTSNSFLNQGTIAAVQQGDQFTLNANFTNAATGSITAAALSANANASVQISSTTFVSSGTMQQSGTANITIQPANGAFNSAIFTGGTVNIGSVNAGNLVITAGSISLGPGFASGVGISGGVFAGTQPFEISTSLNISGGSFLGTGPLTIDQGAFANVTGSIPVSRPFFNAGQLNLNSGRLQLNGGGTQTGTFVVAANAALALGGSAAEVLTASSTISGAGTLQFIQNDKATIDGNYDVGTTFLLGKPSVAFDTGGSTANLTINGGTMTVGSAPTAAGLASVAPADAAPFSFEVMNQPVLNGGVVTVLPGWTLACDAGLTFVGGSPVIDLDASDATPGKLLLGGDVSFTASSGNSEILSGGAGGNPGQIDLGGASRAFTINKADTSIDLSIAATVVNGGIGKDGAGLLQLASANSYAGGTTATAGTLEVDNAGALGSGPLTFAGGILALRTGGTPLANTIVVSPTRPIRLDVGNLPNQLPTPVPGSVLSVTGSAGGSLTLNGPLALRNNLIVNSVVPVTINGTISGNFGLTKTANSTLTLAGAASNTWTGATTLDAGILALDKTGGALAVPADVLVNGPATLVLLQPNQLAATANVAFNDAAGRAELDLDGQSQTLASISSVTAGSGTVLLDGGTLAVADKSGFSGTITSSKAPNLLSTIINDGSGTTAQTQRSEVRQIVLSFDRLVTLSAGALTLSLLNSGGSGTNNGAAPTNATAALGTPTSSDGGFTWVVPILAGTAFSDATGSLSDGIYSVALHAAAVTATISGKNLAADSSLTFHRLFGDINGDKRVNNSDYFQFNKAFGSAKGGARYNADVDYNGDGSVNNVDFFQFNKRFGRTFTY